MKKIILLIGILAILYSLLYAGDPPKNIKKAFEKRFTHAKNVVWNQAPTHGWEAVFTMKGHKTYVNYTIEGIWLVTETDLLIGSLPKAVTDAIILQYPGWTINKADINESSKAGVIYGVMLIKGLETKRVSYREDGTSINDKWSASD